MVACTIIYIVVAAAAVGALPYTGFAKSPEPLALILREIGSPGVATLVAAAAVIALPTVLLAFLYGQSRIFLVMARDGFLPQSLATVSPTRGTPVRITLITAVLVAIIAGVMPIDAIAALANAGTLAAFIAVSVAMLVLRRRDPGAVRTFRTPLAWLVGPMAVLGCLYLFASLPAKTQEYFLIWNAIGLVVYFGYGRARSLVTSLPSI
jgi:basic amino acid/polyamine antiporter, APA family